MFRATLVLFGRGCKLDPHLPAGRQNVTESNMKTKFLVSGFLIMVLAGVFFTLKFGLQPRPLAKINISSFETPLKFAESIELRLREEIKATPILILGYQPEKPHQLELVREFLKSNKEPEMSYEAVVADEHLDLPTEIGVSEKIDTNQKIEALAQGLKTALEQKRRVVLIVPSIYSAQLVGGNVADLLKRQYQLPIGSFTVVELPRTREQEKEVTIPCLMKDADNTGTGSLGCAILQAGRATYRKKMPPGFRTGMMDQRGGSDFLIFYSNEVEKARE